MRGGPVSLVALALAGAAAAGSSAGPPPDTRITAFKPIADSYVTASQPRANFGRLPVLRVDGAPETTTYLRFKLAKIDGSITSVTLLLHSTTAARARYAVRRVPEDEWRERRLTYMNAPQPSSRYAASRPVQRGMWSAVDVTPFVDESGGEISLAITTQADRRLSFSSRESKRGPRLVVRSEDVEGDQAVEEEIPQTP